MATKKHERQPSDKAEEIQKKDRSGTRTEDSAIRKRDSEIQNKVPPTDPPERPPAKSKG